jgi:predicted phosphodiesterase
VRIAIVSDIHGNLAALEAVAADIRQRGADGVVNLGDNLSGPLLPLETAQFLMASGWLSLAGNHERQLLGCEPGREENTSDGYARSQLGTPELDWLRSLHPRHQLTEEIMLCHGTPDSDCSYLLETSHHGVLRLASVGEIGDRLGSVNAGVVACGHTHVPRSVRLASGQLIVNPGSVGLQGFTDDYTGFHIMETGSPDARYVLLENTASGWLVEQRCVPYDHASMAALAKLRACPDWEVALLYGRAQ